jgi:hypothetical protein
MTEAEYCRNKDYRSRFDSLSSGRGRNLWSESFALGERPIDLGRAFRPFKVAEHRYLSTDSIPRLTPEQVSAT